MEILQSLICRQDNTRFELIYSMPIGRQFVKKIQYVNVTAGNLCPAGAICVQNTCPSGTVNLNNAYSIANLPAGTVVSWHTGTPAANNNKLTPAQAAARISIRPLFTRRSNITASNCYSATILVGVTIRNCPGEQGY
jgi:hypothetical protein